MKTLSLVMILVLNLLILGQVWNPPQSVREIPNPQLPDIAMASYDAFGPVIYYNPILAQRLGILITMFFRAHEYGHVYLNHYQKTMFQTNPFARIHLSQKYELEADCFATSELCKINRNAVLEAIKFFNSQGPILRDVYHPSGTIRAQNIKNCFDKCTKLDDEEEIDKEDKEVSCNFYIPDIRIGELGGIIDIYIDDNLIGTISNFPCEYNAEIEIDSITQGLHRYKLIVKVFSFINLDPIYNYTLIGRGTINIEHDDSFVVSNGALSPKLIKEE